MSILTDSPPPPIRSEDKIWIVLSHLSLLMGVGIFLPLVVYLVKKDESPAVGAHAMEALNFHISVCIYALFCLPLVMLLIGLPLLMGLVLGAYVLAIVAAVKAADGELYRYPLTIRLVS